MKKYTPKEWRKFMNRLMAYRKEYFVVSMLSLLLDGSSREEI